MANIFAALFLKSKRDKSSKKLLGWCEEDRNKIGVIDLNTQQNYANFEGVQLKNFNGI